jgi:hypothetical protein
MARIGREGPVRIAADAGIDGLMIGLTSPIAMEYGLMYSHPAPHGISKRERARCECASRRLEYNASRVK